MECGFAAVPLPTARRSGAPELAAGFSYGLFDVEVFERSAVAGGRVEVIEDEATGVRHDGGASLFLMPQVYRQFFEDVGEKLEDHLELTRVDPAYTVFLGDEEGATETRVELTADALRMREQLEAVEEGSFAAYLRWLEQAAFYFENGMRFFIERNFYSPLDYLAEPLAKLRMALRLNPLRSHEADLRRLGLRSPLVRALLSFQDLYVGLEPASAPSIFSLLPYTEIIDGVWYPRGGMGEVSRVLLQLAERAGARVSFGRPVRRLVLEDSRVTGVELADGTFEPADLVVCNADLSTATELLLPPAGSLPPRAERERRRVLAMESCSGVISFYWSVRGPLGPVSQHSVFLARDKPAAWRQIFRAQGAERLADPHFYMHAPSVSDPSCCGAGGAVPVMVLVPVPHIKSGGEDWAAATERAREAVLARVEQAGVFSRGQLLSEVARTPADWARGKALHRGAVFGLRHGLFELGWFRPANKHPSVGGLYFVGASTHPGNGVPLVLISSRLVVQRLLRDLGLEQLSN
eukprot:tig00000880_g5162.t1